MRGQLAAVLGVALTATLSGCSAFVADATTTAGTPAPRVSVSPSPMRVVTVAPPKPRSAAPGLSNTGSSWKSIVTSLSGYGQWLLGNPDPSLVGNVAAPGCGMADLLGRQVVGLLGSQTYVQTAPPVISQVIGPSAATAGALGPTVGLTVVASRPAEPVVSRKAGKPVTTFAPWGPSTLHVTLTKGTDNRWRFCDVQSVGDMGAPDDPSVALV